MTASTGRQPSDYGPIDFVPYGVAGPWRYRWLNSFEAIGDQPVFGVWLGHADEQFRGVLLGTYARRHYLDHFGIHAHEDPMASVARAAAMNLITLTKPNLPEPTGRQLTRKAIAHADDEGAAYQSWRTAAWTVDTTAVTAQLWDFASGWAGIAELPDTYLIAVTDDIDNVGDTVTITPIADGAPYHIDFNQTLAPQSGTDLDPEIQDIPSRFWHRRSMHPDYQTLLDQP